MQLYCHAKFSKGSVIYQIYIRQRHIQFSIQAGSNFIVQLHPSYYLHGWFSKEDDDNAVRQFTKIFAGRLSENIVETFLSICGENLVLVYCI